LSFGVETQRVDSHKVARVFDAPVVVAALLVIPVVVIEASSSIGIG
jgi:hypothetical protein